MRVEIIKCNNCKKLTEDIYAEKGWIGIVDNGGSSFAIAVSGGRKKDGSVKSLFFNSGVSELHFCCAHCMLAWMKLLKV